MAPPYEQPIFDYASSAAPPMYEGRPDNFYGMFNKGDSPMAMLVLQLLQPAITSMMGRQGMVPGQFMPMQNPYDQFRAQRYYQGQQEAMQMAAQRDTETYMDIARGAARLAGIDQTDQWQQTTGTMIQDFTKISPMLAQMAPEIFEKMHGTRGSATLLAQSLHRAGQHAIDPVTGGIGFSGQTAGSIADEIFALQFGRGANLAEMRGIGAGSAGMLYEQLAQRGLNAPSIGRMDQATQLRELAAWDPDAAAIGRLAKRGSRTESAVRDSFGAIKGLADKQQTGKVDFAEMEKIGGLDDIMRTFDAQQITGRLKNLSGVVAAMRDVFGDMGRPNAPMREIVNGLEMLTQSALATQSPAAVETMVRRTQAIARQSGVSMTTVFGLTGQAAKLADRFGLDRGIAAQAVQGGVSFGAAAGNVGRLDIPAFGSLSKEQLNLLDTQLRISAGASPLANQMNTAARLIDEELANRRDAKGNLTPLGEMAKSVAAGQTTFNLNGRQRSFDMRPEEFLGLLEQSGLSRQEAEAALRAEPANQEYGQKYQTQNAARSLQGVADILPIVAGEFEGAVGELVNDLGLTGREGLDATAAISQQVAQATMRLNPQQYRDTGLRNTTLGLAVQTAVEAQVRSRAAAQGLTPQQIDVEVAKARQQLSPMRARHIGAAGWVAADKIFKRDPTWANATGGGGMTGVHQLYGGTIDRAAASARAQADTEVEMARMASGWGTIGPLGRVADAAINAKTSDTLETLISKGLGGISVKDLNKDNPALKAFAQAQRDFTNASRHTGILTDAEAFQRAANELQLPQQPQETEAVYRARVKANPYYADAEKAARDAERSLKGDYNPAGIQTQKEAMIRMDALGLSSELSRQELRRLQDDFGVKGDLNAELLRRAINASDRPAAERAKLTDYVTGLDRSRIQALQPMITEAGYDPERQLSQKELGLTERYGADAKRLGTAEANAEFLDSTQKRINTLLNSTADMKQLGEGGLDAVRGMQVKTAEIVQLAKSLDVTPGELLAGTFDLKKHKGARSKIQEAQALRDSLLKDVRSLGTKQQGPTPLGDKAMTEYEQQQLADEQKFRAQSPEKQKETLADALTAQLPEGIARTEAAPGEKRQKLIDALTDHELPVFRATQARKDLLKMVEERGLLEEPSKSSHAAQEQAIKALGDSQLDASDRSMFDRANRASQSLKAVGTEQGDSLDELLKIIQKQSITRQPPDGDKPGEKVTKTKIDGTLKVVGLDKAILTANGQVFADSLSTTPIETS